MIRTTWLALLILWVASLEAGCGDSPVGVEAQETGAISGSLSPKVSDAVLEIHQDGVLLTRVAPDDNGEYLIQNLPEGEYDISATGTDYVTLTSVEDVHVEAGQTTVLGQISLIRISSANADDWHFDPAPIDDDEEVIVLRVEGMF